MITEKILTQVIDYLAKHGDSEADEEMRFALIWARDGKIREDETPVIIQCALSSVEGAETEQPSGTEPLFPPGFCFP